MSPATRRKSGAIWLPSYYHQDALGSTKQLTDTTETTLNTYQYNGWGELLNTTETTTNPFQFTGNIGYYYDRDAAALYIRARTYQPAIGRWWSVDPLGFVDGVNLFTAYYLPSGIDPSGLNCRSVSYTAPVLVSPVEPTGIIYFATPTIRPNRAKPGSVLNGAGDTIECTAKNKWIVNYQCFCPKKPYTVTYERNLTWRTPFPKGVIATSTPQFSHLTLKERRNGKFGFVKIYNHGLAESDSITQTAIQNACDKSANNIISLDSYVSDPDFYNLNPIKRRALETSFITRNPLVVGPITNNFDILVGTFVIPHVFPSQTRYEFLR